jgi:hypothetical protein
MKINLKELKTAYINLDDYPNRNATMVNMLDSYGMTYTRIPGVVLQGFDPIAQAHLNAIETGAELILEDDCLPFDYREEFEVPDDADVVFLGVSTGTSHTHRLKYKKLSNDIYRLYDMTTVHAILYITDAGRQWLRNAYHLTVNNKIRFDIATAKLMPTIKAYGLNSPIWYQRDLGSQTQKTLDEALLSDECFGGGYDDYPEPIKFERKKFGGK